jgi:O-antigen/teichoic acid export membrane protein
MPSVEKLPRELLTERRSTATGRVEADGVDLAAPVSVSQPLGPSSVLGSIATVIGGTGAAVAIGFVTTLVLVRNLPPAEYGVLAVLDMIVGVSAGLLATGLNLSMIRSMSALRHDPRGASSVARRVLKLQAAYGMLVAAALFLTADFLATRVLHHPELGTYLRLSSLAVLGYIGFEYRRAIFQALKAFRIDAVFSVTQAALYLLIVVILLTVHQLHIRSVAVAYVSVPLIVSLFALAFLWKRLAIAAPPRQATRPTAVAGSGWLICYTLCLYLIGQIHMLTVTRYFPLGHVGLYAFAFKIYGISLLFMNAVKVVLLPTFSEISSRQRLKRAFGRALRGTALASVLWLASIPFVGFFVGAFAGGRFDGATPMLQILMVGAAASTLLSPAAGAVIALERYRVLALGGLAVLAANAVGHALVTTRAGGTGAAAVQVASHLALNSYFLLEACRGLRTERTEHREVAPCP